MIKTLVVVAATAALGLAWGQTAAPILKSHDQIDWKVSPSLPLGAEYHLVYEDKNSHSVETLVRFPSGYVLPPHSHSNDETILILRGKLEIEVAGRSTVLGPGSYALIPAGMTHALKAKGWGRCEILALLTGPFDIKGLPPVK